VPYKLRHTALTNLGEKAGGDVFVLARIAGHSSITVTQRYIHPQAEAINRVFSQVGTKLGTVEEAPKLKRTRTASVMPSKQLKTKKKLVPGVGVEPRTHSLSPAFSRRCPLPFAQSAQIVRKNGGYFFA
jgi:hypothetical protein